MENLWEKLNELVMIYGPKLIGALITLIIGFWVIKIIQKALSRIMEKKDIDRSLRGFLNSMVGVLLKVLLFISVIGMMGIQMTSFIAILGAAGLAVGMALSGTLQNFAGGVMLLIFKPFKIGDYLSAQGQEGVVDEIQIFNTILKTLDNKKVIIPNGGLSTDTMINYTAEPLRRVDFVFGIAYGSEIVKARKVLMDTIAKDERILTEPAPFIAVNELADSSVNIAVRVWGKTEDYWNIYFDINENVYNALNKAGIGIPFPQLDVHMQK